MSNFNLDGPDGIFAGYGDHDDPTRDTRIGGIPNLIRELRALEEESREAEETHREETRKWEGIQARYGEGKETFLDRLEIYQLLQQKAESQ